MTTLIGSAVAKAGMVYGANGHEAKIIVERTTRGKRDEAQFPNCRRTEVLIRVL